MNELPPELLNAPVLIGLEAQGRIPAVQRLLADGRTWDEIGEAIGWCPATAREWYIRWLSRQPAKSLISDSGPPRPAHEIRIELAGLGWNTEDRLADFGWGSKGKRGYCAWVSRWNWHGVRLGVAVKFGASVRPDVLTPEAIDRAWERCRRIAIQAWHDLPDCIPHQDLSGRAVRDEPLTQIMLRVHKGDPWKAAREGLAVYHND